MRTSLVLAAVLWSGVTALCADELSQSWSSWRGPLNTGYVEKADPPVSWGADRNVAWRVEIPGKGLSSPVVWGDRIFLTTAVRTEEAPPASEGGDRRRGQPKGVHEFRVLAIDRKTGQTVWSKAVKTEQTHESIHPDASNASASAVTDGRHVVAHFGSRGLYCLDIDGKLLWEKNLGLMHTRNEFGEGSSPALYEGTLVVTWDHEKEDFITALDVETGKEKWRTARDEPTTWSTPLIVPVGGRPQVITAGSKQIRGYDLSSGEVIWHSPGLTLNVIPTPIFDRATGLAIFMSGFRGAAMKAIRLEGASGDLSNSPNVAWEFNKDTPYVPSAMLSGEHLYFGENNRPVVSCINARTGEKIFGPHRFDELDGIYSSIVGARDRVYVVGRNGTTVVLKRGDKPEILAINHLPESIDASPAIVGQDLLLRGHKHLYCLRPEGQ